MDGYIELITNMKGQFEANDLSSDVFRVSYCSLEPAASVFPVLPYISPAQYI